MRIRLDSKRLIIITPVLSVASVMAFTASVPAAETPATPSTPDSKEVCPSALQFTLVFDSLLDSQFMQDGDPVQGHLKETLVLNGKTIAPANSALSGRLEISRSHGSSPRKPLSRKPPSRQSIKIVFYEIILPGGKHMKIRGCLARQNDVFNNEGTFKKVEISAAGEIVLVQSILKTDSARDKEDIFRQESCQEKPPGLLGMKPQGLLGMKPQGLLGMKPQGLLGMKPQGLLPGIKSPGRMTGMKPPAGMAGMKPPAMPAGGLMSQPLGMLASAALPQATALLTRQITRASQDRKSKIFIQPGDELLAQASLFARAISVQGRILDQKETASVSTIEESIDFESTQDSPGALTAVCENTRQEPDQSEYSARTKIANKYTRRSSLYKDNFRQDFKSPPEDKPPGLPVLRPLQLLGTLQRGFPGASALPGMRRLNLMNSIPGLGPLSQPVGMLATSTVPVAINILARQFNKPVPERKEKVFSSTAYGLPEEKTPPSKPFENIPEPGEPGTRESGEEDKRDLRPEPFPIVVTKKIETAYTFRGDTFEGILSNGLNFPGELSVPPGSHVIGHIDQVRHSRRLGKAIVSKVDRFRRDAVLTVELDEIITPENEHVQIAGYFCPQFHVFNNSGNFKAVAVAPGGQILGIEDLMKAEPSQTAKLVQMAARMVVTQACGDTLSMGAMPVVMGLVGAAAPFVVSGKAVEEDDTSRTKGFVLGATGQIPGGVIIRGFIYKGDEFCLEEGDEILAEAHLISKEIRARRIETTDDKK